MFTLSHFLLPITYVIISMENKLKIKIKHYSFSIFTPLIINK